MKLTDVRSFRDATPFTPFTICLSDGREYRIPHRDFIFISESGRYALLYNPDESFTSLHLIMVTQIRTDPPIAKTEGRNGTYEN